MDPSQLHDFVILPTLDRLGPRLRTLAARQLVLGTGMVESRLAYLRQLPRGDSAHGPALGLFQMEPDTHDDIWEHFLRFRPELAHAVKELLPVWPQGPQAMVGNLSYATAMCRMHYWRRHEPLPPEGDAEKLARYWKLYYNTYLGAGKAEDAVTAFKHAVQIVRE